MGSCSVGIGALSRRARAWILLDVANSQAVHISSALGITVPCSVPIKGHMETAGAVKR